MGVTLHTVGTIDFTNGSATIVGHGTDWIDALLVNGDLVLAPDGEHYELTFTTNTAATLDRPYAGTTALLAQAPIFKMSTARDSVRTATKQFSEIASTYHNVVNLTGDDRLIMLDKAQAADDAGILLRSDEGDAFKIGGFGNDNFTFNYKDGATWTPSITLDKTTGAVKFHTKMTFGGTITPAALLATTNDYAPAGIETANLVRLSATANRILTGITSGTDGRVLALVNGSAFNITLAAESASSTAANRFKAGADQVMAPNEGVWLIYDGVDQRWKFLAGSSRGLSGDKGWAPILATVTDGTRRVHQVIDWTGGQGTKPATGQYIGATGLVTPIASAVDIRGPSGANGADGTPAEFQVDLPSKQIQWRLVGAGSWTNLLDYTLLTGPVPAFEWIFDANSVANSNPSNTWMRTNNTTFASITELYISKNERYGSDVSAFLAAMGDSTTATDRGQITLIDVLNPAIFAVYKVNGVPVSNTGYYTIPVAPVTGQRAAHGRRVSLAFARSGNTGSAAGDVVGPASATDNAIARFDTTTGKLLQNSKVTISDDGTVLIAPTASSIHRGLSVTSSGAGAKTGTLAYNEITVTNNAVLTDDSSEAPYHSNVAAGLKIKFNAGASQTGFPIPLLVRYNHNVNTSIGFGDHVAIATQMHINTTATSTPYGLRGFYGINASVWSEAGANLSVICGHNAEIITDSGTSVEYRYGVLSQSASNDASVTQASIVDCALGVIAQNNPWKDLIVLSAQNGTTAQSLSASGSFFRTHMAMSITDIFKCSNLTVTGKILDFPKVRLSGDGNLGLGTPDYTISLGDTVGAGSFGPIVQMRGASGNMVPLVKIINPTAGQFGMGRITFGSDAYTGEKRAIIIDTTSQQTSTVTPKGLMRIYANDGSGTVTEMATVQVAGGFAIRGTNTNDNAAAGFVGEYMSANLAAGSAHALSNATWNVLTSITLTPGDWDVYGKVFFAPTDTPSATGISQYAASVTTTSTFDNVPDRVDGFNYGTSVTVGAGNVVRQSLSAARFSVAANTTVNLTGLAVFAGGGCNAYGMIWARRRR